MASNLIIDGLNLIAMAPNHIATASNLIATASGVHGPQQKVVIDLKERIMYPPPFPLNGMIIIRKSPRSHHMYAPGSMFEHTGVYQVLLQHSNPNMPLVASIPDGASAENLTLAIFFRYNIYGKIPGRR